MKKYLILIVLVVALLHAGPVFAGDNLVNLGGSIYRDLNLSLNLNQSCITCHHPHQHKRGDVALFSIRCLQCHQITTCGKVKDLGADRIEHRCIHCHMPSRRDAATTMEQTAGVITAALRDHRIGIWPGVTEQVVGQILSAD